MSDPVHRGYKLLSQTLPPFQVPMSLFFQFKFQSILNLSVQDSTFKGSNSHSLDAAQLDLLGRSRKQSLKSEFGSLKGERELSVFCDLNSDICALSSAIRHLTSVF